MDLTTQKNAVRILIIDDIHEIFFEKINAGNFQCDYFPHIKAQEAEKIIADYEGLIVRSKMKIDENLLHCAPNLKFIGRAGAGLDLINLTLLKEKNIQLFHAAEGNADAVGEHTIGMLLCMLNQLHQADFAVKNGVWNREAARGYELKGKTVGIIGYGNMGKSVARKLRGFGCKVLTYDKKGAEKADENALMCDLQTVQHEADIVCLHIPLDEGNRKIVNFEYINNFKKSFILLNMARGEILDHAALVEAMQSGKIKAACLDVLENEKLATFNEAEKMRFDYLVQSKKVLFSPHVAGWTFESYQKISEVLADKILAFYGDNHNF